MPPTDTICISFGNWIIAFYVVYAMAAVAVVAASGMLIDWSVGMAKRSRLAATAKVSRPAQVAESRA